MMKSRYCNKNIKLRGERDRNILPNILRVPIMSKIIMYLCTHIYAITYFIILRSSRVFFFFFLLLEISPLCLPISETQRDRNGVENWIVNTGVNTLSWAWFLSNLFNWWNAEWKLCLVKWFASISPRNGNFDSSPCKLSPRLPTERNPFLNEWSGSPAGFLIGLGVWANRPFAGFVFELFLNRLPPTCVYVSFIWNDDGMLCVFLR